MRTTWLSAKSVTEQDSLRVFGQILERDQTLSDLLKRPEVTYDSLVDIASLDHCLEDPESRRQIEIQAKYHGYVERQKEEVVRRVAHENTRLPMDLDYRNVRGLSHETQQKLNQFKPETLGQASRISGITPAAMSLLLVHLKRGFAKPDDVTERVTA